MTDWGAAVVARLEARVELMDRLGSYGVDWVVRPAEAGLDAVVLQVVSDPRPDHFGGAQGFRRTLVSADCFSARSADAASKIAEEVIAAVRPELGEPGVASDGGWEQDGVRFGRTGVEGPVDSGEQADGLYVHRARLELAFWHT